MTDLYLPALRYFENNNRFSGSYGMLRFMITPEVKMKNAKEVDLPASAIIGELWHGQLCIEKSIIEKKQTFAMSDTGIIEIRQWLEENI